MAPDTVSRVHQIPPHQLGRRRPFPVIIHDREKLEFVLGHINGAKRISPNRLEERIGYIVPDLTTPIVLYCAAGDRCAAVADYLQKNGIPKHIYPEGWSSGGWKPED